MKKVVLKCQVPDLARLERKLADVGMEFSAAVWQHERIYWPGDFRPQMNYPRLIMRTEVARPDLPAQYSMYLKRHIEDSGVDYVYMTGVNDYTAATGIVHQLGFRKSAEMSRRRQELRLDAHTVLYLDKVEGLEDYFLKLEVELIDEDTPIEAVRRTLYQTLDLLKIKTFITQTYGELLAGHTMQPYYLPESSN